MTSRSNAITLCSGFGGVACDVFALGALLFGEHPNWRALRWGIVSIVGVALVLFFGSFLVILLVTFTRPRKQTDRYAHMPLADDQDLEPMTPIQTNARQGGEPS